MSDSLRPSVVYAGVVVARLVKLRGMQPAEAIAHLRQGSAQLSTYDYDAAAQMAGQHGWNLFSHDLDTAAAFRLTIENWMLLEQPLWYDLLPLGRARTLSVLSSNMVACFENAELLGQDPAALAWWDHAASIARQAIDERLLALGREAERWTYEREIARLAGTGLTPVWMAVEDNSAGYDVRSFRSRPSPAAAAPSMDWHELHIEVKYTGAVSVHISAREWRFALEHEDSWELQVWKKGAAEALVFWVRDLQPHMPENHGSGCWESVEVRLAALIPDDDDAVASDLTWPAASTTSDDRRRLVAQ